MYLFKRHDDAITVDVEHDYGNVCGDGGEFTDAVLFDCNQYLKFFLGRGVCVGKKKRGGGGRRDVGWRKRERGPGQMCR